MSYLTMLDERDPSRFEGDKVYVVVVRYIPTNEIDVKAVCLRPDKAYQVVMDNMYASNMYETYIEEHILE